MVLIIFLLGLCFGSFINVLIYRVPKNLSIMGRSFCPRCKKKIIWKDNIPLFSYLLLGGKCRRCKKLISLQYPIIELATALIFLVTYLASKGLAFGSYIPYIVYVYILIVILIAIFVIDIKYRIISDQLIYFGYLTTFVYLLLFNPGNIFENLFSGFTVSLFLLFLHLATRGRGMGLGDVKLALFAGTFLGFPRSIVFIYLAFLTGAVVGIILIMVRIGKFGKQIAFGPFLAMSFWVTVVWGEQIWKIIKTVLP